MHIHNKFSMTFLPDAIKVMNPVIVLTVKSIQINMTCQVNTVKRTFIQEKISHLITILVINFTFSKLSAGKILNDYIKK